METQPEPRDSLGDGAARRKKGTRHIGAVGESRPLLMTPFLHASFFNPKIIMTTWNVCAMHIRIHVQCFGMIPALWPEIGSVLGSHGQELSHGTAREIQVPQQERRTMRGGFRLAPGRTTHGLARGVGGCGSLEHVTWHPQEWQQALPRPGSHGGRAVSPSAAEWYPPQVQGCPQWRSREPSGKGGRPTPPSAPPPFRQAGPLRRNPRRA